MKTPCRNCEKQGCGTYHDKCEKYIKFKQENEERIKALYKQQKNFNHELYMRSKY